tara:strand:+ start:306 stop:593 length:288 start_codon:yes stop_codon:yes gene_type:complete
MSVDFHDALRIADGNESIPQVYEEEHRNLICDDFFLDKCSEYIHAHLGNDEFNDEYYEIYNSISNKEFEDDLNAIELFIILKVLIYNEDVLQYRR